MISHWTQESYADVVAALATRYGEKQAEKRAAMPTMADIRGMTSTIAANPGYSALAGAGIGGLAGLAGSHFAPRNHPDDKPDYLSGALQGAVAGGAIGGGASLAGKALRENVVEMPKDLLVQSTDNAGKPVAARLTPEQINSQTSHDIIDKKDPDNATAMLGDAAGWLGEQARHYLEPIAGTLTGVAGSGIGALRDKYTRGVGSVKGIRDVSTLRKALTNPESLKTLTDANPTLAKSIDELKSRVANYDTDSAARKAVDDFINSGKYTPTGSTPSPSPPVHGFAPPPPPSPPTPHPELDPAFRDSAMDVGHQAQVKGQTAADAPVGERFKRPWWMGGGQVGTAEDTKGRTSRHRTGAARTGGLVGLGLLTDYLRANTGTGDTIDWSKRESK